MPTQELRGELLRTFDRGAANLMDDSEPRDAEIAVLWDLAAALAASLIAWTSIVDRLRLFEGRDYDIPRAGTLIIESTFDELLDGPACRVLSAAFDLLVTPT